MRRARRWRTIRPMPVDRIDLRRYAATRRWSLVAAVGCVGVVVGLIVGGPGSAASASPGRSSAAAAPAGLDLRVSTTKSSYPHGQAAVLKVIVTNQYQSPCTLAATPAVALQVSSASRDGQTLAPTFIRSTIIDGLGQAVKAHAR